MSVKKKLNAHLWVRHPDDYYIEPEAVSTRLFEMLDIQRFGMPRDATIILDPACGSGRIVRAARRAGYSALGTDKVRRSAECYRTADFLTDTPPQQPDWIVSNPPFALCAMRHPDKAPPFVAKALEVARYGAALLLPLPWLAGATRSLWLAPRLTRLLVCTPRPSMPPGPLIEAGIMPGQGNADFAWFIFESDHTGPWTGGWCDWKPAPPLNSLSGFDAVPPKPACEFSVE